jgi:acyl carrier protein phosphodiesterase
MNFLAHLYLSGNHEKILIGNFIGDFVKGKQMEDYEKEIAWGIQLHRMIDEFTDKHPIVAQSKALLKEKYRHYSPVIVDIFYDHFLARNWEHYHKIPLKEFTTTCYQIIRDNHDLLPQKAKYMFPFMVKNNWLYHYAEHEGIRRVLEGMANRTRFHSKMEQAVEDLNRYYEDFSRHFTAFFPELENLAKDFLKEKAPEMNPRLFIFNQS